MAERTVKVRALKGHCAGALGNFETGDRYELPESQAKARAYIGLVEIVGASAPAPPPAEEATASREEGPEAREEEPESREPRGKRTGK